MTQARALSWQGHAFAPAYDRLVGTKLDLASLIPERFDPALVERARATWQERVQTEYMSAQMMTRFLTDVLAAGDPFDVNAGVVELIADELRHVALCADVVQALGAVPRMPHPTEVRQPEAFLRMPPAQRALSIAITMLIVNETLSVGFLRDLHARCSQPAIFAVLDATLSEESEHDAFGAQYVRRALEESALPMQQWRAVVQEALRPQRDAARSISATIPVDRRKLEAWPDEQEIALGLFSPARQALVFERTYAEQLQPLLRSLQLID